MSRKVSKETVIRTIIAAITLINQILVVGGKNPLPFTNDEIYNALSMTATIAATVWVWWKNNSFTPAAIEADALMRELKGEKYDE